MTRRLLLGLGALFGAVVGCRGHAPPPAPPPQVVVAPVLRMDVPITGEWIGTTEGDVTAEIRPKVDGYLLRRVYAEGAFVHRGDPLFEIDPRQFRAQLDQAEANLEQAEADLARARKDVARFRPLAEEKAVSQQELDNAVSAEQAARATVDSRKAAVNQARLNVGWTSVTSPIDGIAGIAERQVGDLVGPTTALATVSTCDPIRVMFKVSEQEYLRGHRRVNGQPGASPLADSLDLVLSDGTVFPEKGRLIIEGRQVDARTGTISEVGLFPNPGNVLRPGQYARVRGVTNVRRGALLAPQRAVNELQGGFQVAVVGSDNRAEVRAVRTAERVGSLWVIEDGLRPGERVVVEGFSRVKSGALVGLKEDSASSSPAPAGR